MPAKVTFLFQMSTVAQPGENARVAGWSESWVDVNNPINGTAIVGIANDYVNLRCRMLPPTARFVGLRLTDLTTKASRVIQGNGPGSYGQATDLPQMSLLLRMQARSAANHFSFFLRCVPDAVIVGGEFARGANPAFLAALGQWWNYVANNYRFRGKDLTLPTAEIETVDGSGTVTLKEAGPSFGIGDKVQLMRVRVNATCCGIGGTFKVKAVTDPFSFTVSGWNSGAAHGGKAKATAPLTAYTIAGVGNLQAVYARAVEKKVGRPFDLFRGRRSKVCCRMP